VPSSSVTRPIGVDTDTGGGKLYYSEFTTGTIKRVNTLDGSNIETMVTGATSPFGIALDQTNSKIYFTENTGNIKSADLAVGSTPDSPALVTGLSFPREIELDIAAGKMYWTELSGTVKRADLDGTNIETLISGTNPNGLALDIAAGKMYWIEQAASTGTLNQANLDGTMPVTLVTNLDNPFSLDLAGGSLYWTEVGVTDVIKRSDLSGGNITTLVTLVGAANPFGISVYVPELPPGMLGYFGIAMSWLVLRLRRRVCRVDGKKVLMV